MWSLGPKILVPEPVTGHLQRVALVEMVLPTRRRLTVLQAPGGFGKTTLLAECSRRLQDDGIRVAWVSMDEQDDPAILDTYISYACHRAAAGAAAEENGPRFADSGRAGAENGSRTMRAMNAIAETDGSFVLVFDEVERLENPDSAALLDFLMRRGPPNLHLAFAGRKLPAGVNVSGAVLDGRAAIFSAKDLRFSRSEVEAFFEGRLTGRRLSDVMKETAGWPFALRIARNEMVDGRRGDALRTPSFVENWMEARLFDGLGKEEREFLLDIGLLEWIDATLVDEVLERRDSMYRLETMPLLVGMLEPVHDGGMDVWRLHPLIREHCVRRRFRETPDRFRTIHRRIADALERRGQTALAMRHAVEAGHSELAVEMLERAGGVFLVVRNGTAQLLAADRLLGENTIRTNPRMGLVRCLSLMLSGRLEEAGDRYRSTQAMLNQLERDGSAQAAQLAAENCVVRGMLLLYGGERFGSALMRDHLSEVEGLAREPGLDPLARADMEFILCMARGMTARFPEALKHAKRALQGFADNAYMSMYVHIQEGQIAMAEGRAEDAMALYRAARRFATSRHVLVPEPAAICRVLVGELALECGISTEASRLTRVPEALMAGGSPFQAYAAVSGVLVEIKLREEGVDSALAVTEGMLAYLRSARMPALVRLVSALRVSLLATAERIAEGEKTWTSAGLSAVAADCLDLEGQTWREMEALSCAWLRLAIGQGRIDEAREFARDLRALTEAPWIEAYADAFAGPVNCAGSPSRVGPRTRQSTCASISDCSKRRHTLDRCCGNANTAPRLVPNCSRRAGNP